ncbi:MAG: carboxymuconolactone decarboxylase family protein [Deltaproteobacteria bacterium]|nr:carboxymuconolactone decarboxylase family protein [Deltaproteobacteria bacterium]
MKSLNKYILPLIVLGVFLSPIGCATINKGGVERVRLKEARIKPLTESEWTAEQQRILNRYKMPDGRFPNILTTLANHPKFFEKYMGIATYFTGESTLPPREREILILRIGWLCRAEFEFGWHTLYGKSAGLTDEEIKRITDGPKAAGWDPFDVTLLLAVDELYYDAFITDATWNALAKRYNQQQLMDVVVTVGQYNLVSMFLNSFGLQLDDGVPGFPKRNGK